MNQHLNKIIGTKLSDFKMHVSNGSIKLREAKLITTYNPGDEMALTSIFLSALKLIKEFRKDIFADIKLSNSSQILYYTEITFSQFDDSRFDGLILIVKGGIIKDAAVLEVKNKNNDLDQAQIEKYIQVIRQLSIPRLVTISNQFVSMPTQFPISVKIPKSIEIYHFSWSYLLTIAHILLYKNENNIEDEDQVEIMKEVVAYLENNISGVCGFTQMRPGWKEVVEKINAGTRLKLSDNCIIETVSSWHQEARDMALILSRKLGVLVQSGDSKYKNNLKLRISDDSKLLISDKILISNLKVKGAVSDISIKALFEKRIVEMSVCLNVPLDKGLKGQLGWLNRQLDKCSKKDEELFSQLKDDLMIDINIKHAKGCERISLKKLNDIYSEIKNREIKEFHIVLVNDFGKSFASRNKFVEVIEKMLLLYYKGVVQHLQNWEQPAPPLEDNTES